jgi:hypothetical protein
VGDHMIEQPQRVIARHAEDVVDAEFGEAIEEMVGDGCDRDTPGLVVRVSRSRPARLASA